MDWRQKLSTRDVPEKREFLKLFVNEASKYPTVSDAALAMNVNREAVRVRLRTAAAMGIYPDYINPSKTKEGLPKSRATKKRTHEIKGKAKVLCLFDVHVPYHDAEALSLALEYGKAHGVDHIFIGGDFIDCAAASDHEKIPSERMGFVEELEATRNTLKFINGMFPNATKIYKEGNHERRLPRFLAKKAPELYGMPGLTMEHLLHLRELGYTWVDNRTVVEAGHLSIIHGNEYRGGAGINPARNLYLKAGANSMCGDKHRTQEYIKNTIKGKTIGAWSVGCLCDLSPDWLPMNEWNHGFAIIELDEDRGFRVENRKIMHGKVY